MPLIQGGGPPWISVGTDVLHACTLLLNSRTKAEVEIS